MTQAGASSSPRVLRSRERILDGALELLRSRGPRAVTVEAVAATSGVAKTTVYRQFRDRDDVLRAAIGRISRDDLPAPDVPARDRLRWLLERGHDNVANVLGFGCVAAILTGEDPSFTSLFREILTPYHASVRRQLDDDIRAGHLASHVDADALLSLMIGSFLGEYVRYAEVRPDWVERCLDVLWRAVEPTP